MKDYRIKAETGHYAVTGSDAKLVHTVVKRSIHKNWGLVSFYILISIASAYITYFTSEWVSVALSIAVTIVSLIVGWFMAREIVTTTNEVR
jgi:uncharacterized membrane protein HdeD (DUF308 family)